MNGLIWTKTDFTKELTAKGKSIDGPITVDCWDEKDDIIGVPRQFGMSRGLEPDKLSLPVVEWPDLKVGYRPRQQEAIEGIFNGLVRDLGGITELHTGFGKTLVALSLAAKLKTRVLVLAHKEDLLGQFKKAASDFYGIDCGWIQRSKFDYLDKLLTVGTIQTLSQRIDSAPEDFWNYFGLVVADEGHRVPSNTFCSIFKHITAKYRLGMSATFRRFDGLDKIWEWHVGNLIYSDDYKGIPGEFIQWPVKIANAEPRFTYNGKLSVSKLLSHYSSLEIFNNQIVRTIEFLLKQNRKVLVVSDRTEQLVELSKKLEENSFGFYAGSLTLEKKTRKSKGKKKSIGKKELEASKSKPVILATYSKIGEGSDIPSLDTIIFASPRKDIEQVVGRIRRVSEGKKEPLVVDFVLPGGYNKALSFLRNRMLKEIGFSQIYSLKGD